MIRRFLVLILVLSALVAQAETPEDRERQRAYAWARVSRSIEATRDGCHDAYRRLVRSAVSVPGGVVTYTAFVGAVLGYPVMNSMRQVLEHGSAEFAVHNLLRKRLAGLTQAQRRELAEALAVKEIKWMKASHDRSRSIGERVTYPWAQVGGEFDVALAYRLGELHDGALRDSGFADAGERRLLKSPDADEASKEYLPIWKIDRYQAVRATYFERLLRESSAETLGDALEGHLYNGQYKTLAPLGWSRPQRLAFARAELRRLFEDSLSDSPSADAVRLAHAESRFVRALFDGQDEAAREGFEKKCQDAATTLGLDKGEGSPRAGTPAWEWQRAVYWQAVREQPWWEPDATLFDVWKRGDVDLEIIHPNEESLEGSPGIRLRPLR